MNDADDEQSGGKRIIKSDAEWRAKLTSEQYEVCRQKGTERPFSGAYNDCKREGVYRCACCGNALFVVCALSRPLCFFKRAPPTGAPNHWGHPRLNGVVSVRTRVDVVRT